MCLPPRYRYNRILRRCIIIKFSISFGGVLKASGMLANIMLFSYLCPLMSMPIAALGFKIYRNVSHTAK